MGFSETSFGPEAVIDVPLQEVQAGKPGQLRIDLKLPNGYHFNPQAPLTYDVDVSGAGLAVAEADRRVKTMVLDLKMPLAIPFQAASGVQEAKLTIDLTFYYCREEDTGLCAIQTVRWNMPIRTVDDQTAAEPMVSYLAVAPEVYGLVDLTDS